MIYIKKWFEYYDDLFKVAPNQQEFFEELCKNAAAPKKVLSVECGPARISKKLSKKNFDVTATDSYPEFINSINNDQGIDKTQLHVFNLLPQDIGRYLGQNFFDLIVCCNYRLIFMKNKALITKFILDAKNLLKENGYLVLDLLNFSKYDFSKSKIELPVKESERATLYSTLTKDEENATYTLDQYVITNSGKKIDEVVNETVCPISLETFKKLAEDTDFKIEFYSDYNKTPFSKDSDRIICVLKK